jgi:hypothetical protein
MGYLPFLKLFLLSYHFSRKSKARIHKKCAAPEGAARLKEKNDASSDVMPAAREV